jgi:hypothetical protein
MRSAAALDRGRDTTDRKVGEAIGEQQRGLELRVDLGQGCAVEYREAATEQLGSLHLTLSISTWIDVTANIAASMAVNMARGGMRFE